MLTRQGEPLLVHEAKAYGLLRGVVSAPAAHRLVLVDEAPRSSPPASVSTSTSATHRPHRPHLRPHRHHRCFARRPPLRRAFPLSRDRPSRLPRRERASCTCSPPAAPHRAHRPRPGRPIARVVSGGKACEVASSFMARFEVARHVERRRSESSSSTHHKRPSSIDYSLHPAHERSHSALNTCVYTLWG